MRSPLANRPVPGSQVGLSFCHWGTERAKVSQFQRCSRFGFSRPAVKQKWYLCSQPPKSTPSGIHTPMKQCQVTRQKSRLRLAAAHSAKDRKPGKGTRWLLFSRNNGKSLKLTHKEEKNGSFRKHVCRLLSYYFYRATQAGSILTHQTLGYRPSSQASPSARECRA